MFGHGGKRVGTAAVGLILGAAAQADPCITRVEVAPLPPITSVTPGVYDTYRETTVMVDLGSTPRVLEFNGQSWSLVQTAHVPPTLPPPLSGAIAFDQIEGVTVFIGGGEVWTYDGSDWTNRGSFPGAGVARASAAFDEARGVLVLFGGSPSSGTYTNTVREWDGASLVTRTIANPPPPRARAAMAYDPVRQRTVMFGGLDANGQFDDLWEYDGQAWTQLDQGSVHPEARADAMMEFDRRRAVMTLVAASLTPGEPLEFWEWAGGAWRSRVIANPLLNSVARATYVFEDSSGAMLLAGSNAPTSRLVAPALPAVSGPAPVQASISQPASLTVVSNDARALTYQWRKNGQILPGATGSSIGFLSLQAEDAGYYDCIVSVNEAAAGCADIVAGPALLAVLPACAEDLNGDGLIDFADLNRVISSYNVTCPGQE